MVCCLFERLGVPTCLHEWGYYYSLQLGNSYDIIWKVENVHIISGLLKTFLRSLPEPAFPFHLWNPLTETLHSKSFFIYPSIYPDE